MLRIPLLILILLSLSSFTAYAQDDTTPAIKGDFSDLKRMESGQIQSIIDALTISLTDGRIVRLSSLDIPGFVYPEPSDLSLKARDELSALLKANMKVNIFQTRDAKKGRVNRMGHQLGHLETPDGVWVQGHLLHSGLARAAPTPSNADLIEQMYAIEDIARAEKRGLWEKSAYPLLDHNNAIKASGQFGVIEGVIQNAASVKNKIYLNFGSDWRKDFTVMIEPRVRKLMVRAGIDPLSLNGQSVQVRGWVREYNGPIIELEHPAALRLLTNEGLKGAAQSPTVP